MTHWFTPAWIVQTLIATILLMALVLVARPLVMRAFGAKIAYALWLLPALRMVLPPLPGWRTLMIPVMSFRPHEATFGLTDPASATKLRAAVGAPQSLPPEMVVQLPPMDPPPLELHAALPPAPPPAHPLDWAAILLTIWLVGAVVVFVTQLVRYRLFLNRALIDSFRLSRECGIDVLVSEHVSGPIAAGIFKRRILLPGNFLGRYSSEERRLALKHEAAHHDRLDIVANLAALGLVALHWWNPLAHRAYRAFRADQELACDATVLRGANAQERHSYGSAMLKSASGRMPAMACALSHKEQLKKRILMMANAKFGPVRLLAGAALAATTIGGGLLLTATGQAREPARIVTIDVPPSVPTPPALPAAISRVVPPAPPALPTRIAQVMPPVPPVPPVPPRKKDCPDTREAAERGREATREAGREAAEAGREAAREAAQASREAARETAEAAREASRASAEQARNAADYQRMARAQIPDVARLVRASMDSARAGLRAQCAAQGVRMPATADIGVLATCGNHIHEVVLSSLRQARGQIARDRSMPDDARARALAGIDSAIASNSAKMN